MENSELRFTDLKCWVKSREMVNFIFEITKNTKNYNLKNQLERAVISVYNNIVEGYSKKSNKEKNRFFDISMASCNEVAGMSFILMDMQICSETQALEIQSRSIEIRKMLTGLIKHFT